MVGTVVLSHYMSPIEGNVGHPFKLFGREERGDDKWVLFCVYSCLQ